MELKETSPMIFKDKYSNKIYTDNNGNEIYYLSDKNCDELLFLYKNTNYPFNFIENEIKVFTDVEYFKRHSTNSAIASSVMEHYQLYDIGGYPLRLQRIKNNLYSITYGSFNNINKHDDINNSYGQTIKANSIFIHNALKYLFKLFPDIVVFDAVADFRNYPNPKVKCPKTDFERRISFFTKNNFLILTKKNQVLIEKNKYYKTIVKLISKRENDSFVYLNKNIFELTIK